MMKRTLDATSLNAVANDPAVRPMLGGEGVLDLAPLAENPANHLLAFEGGGFVGCQLEPGVVEVHTLFRPDVRGRSAREAADAALAYMFTETACVELVTRVPVPNRAARIFAEVSGFTWRFSRSLAWSMAGDLYGVDYLGLTIEAWALKSKACLAAGQAFHARLEAAKIASGSASSAHDEDAAHDHMAGAAFLMVAAGNAEKAVTFYNRWARLAGYGLIGLVSLNPCVVDIGDAVISARGGEMDILKCR